MKKILIVIIICFLTGCQTSNGSNGSGWYMLYNSSKSGSNYIPLFDGSNIDSDHIEAVKEIAGVEEVLPLYKLIHQFVEYGKMDDGPQGYIKVYANNELIKETSFNSENYIGTNPNVIGYPDESIFKQYIQHHDDTIVNGAYLSNLVAQQLGISNLKEKITLEISVIIPATSTISSLSISDYPEYIKTDERNSQLFYPYVLTVEIAGILNSKTDRGISPIYIPIETVNSLINEYKLEDFDSIACIIKTDSTALDDIEELRTSNQLEEYPLIWDSYSATVPK